MNGNEKNLIIVFFFNIIIYLRRSFLLDYFKSVYRMRTELCNYLLQPTIFLLHELPFEIKEMNRSLSLLCLFSASFSSIHKNNVEANKEQIEG